MSNKYKKYIHTLFTIFGLWLGYWLAIPNYLLLCIVWGGICGLSISYLLILEDEIREKYYK